MKIKDHDAPQERNRFDGDYDVFLDKGADNNHPGALHNKIYADKLHEFIKNNLSI